VRATTEHKNKRLVMKRCHRCGNEWVSDKRQPGPKEFCSGCSAYLHCCLNCRFHDKHAHNQCQIPNTEWVSDRAGCNFCDEFEFAGTNAQTADAGKKDEARDAFSDLFGDAGSEPQKGPDDFKRLFGD
jgi:hypothetical protein